MATRPPRPQRGGRIAKRPLPFIRKRSISPERALAAAALGKRTPEPEIMQAGRMYGSLMLNAMAKIHDPVERLARAETYAEGDIATILRLDIPDAVARDVSRRGVVALADSAARDHTKRLRAVAGGVRVPVLDEVPQELIEQWIAENVDLITNATNTARDQMELVFRETIERGARPQTTARLLRERLDVAESRVMLIADDQTNKIFSQVARYRDTQLGLERYFWRSQKEGRVRPLHRELDAAADRGETWTYAEGHPVEKHPGMPIRCRCWADPDFSTLI